MDLVSRFSSTVLSLIAGMMICVVFSMSSELVVIFVGEENEVVTVSEFAGPRVDVSDFEEVVILSVFVFSVVREGKRGTDSFEVCDKIFILVLLEAWDRNCWAKFRKKVDC